MSASRKGGLGRGLGALLPPPGGADAGGDRPQGGKERPQPVVGAELREIAVSSVRPNERQPRSAFDEDALDELVHSIREIGVLQPIVVREHGSGDYELVMGERRWRAARLAGLDSMPAIVRETADEAMLRDALLENLHRQQLNPLEEAAAYQQLLAEFGVTHDELATRLGRSRPQISNTMRLLQLPPAVQRRVAAGVLTAGHARALLSIDDPGAQEELAGRIVAEGLSVRSTEEIAALHDPARHPARGKRRGRQPLDPAVAELTAGAAHLLSERLDTRVKVDLGHSKGRLTVEFAGVEDLQRIVAAIVGPSAG